jgi:hypothetical protein
MQSEHLKRCLPWLTASLFAASCAAQVMQQPGTLPGRGTVQPPAARGASHAPEHPAAEPSGAAATPAPGVKDSHAAAGPALPPSLLDKPAQPAKVTLNDGVLAIHADNSSLSAILQHLTSSSGMLVDGFQEDSRVFGVYGPGSPQDVLSSLLTDAGYNFLMVGTTEQGTPREVVLTTSSGGKATTGASQTPAQPDEQPDTDDSDNNNSPPEPMQDRSIPPGASTPPPNSNGPVKTPAEIIQELQRLRQQQNPQ